MITGLYELNTEQNNTVMEMTEAVGGDPVMYKTVQIVHWFVTIG